MGRNNEDFQVGAAHPSPPLYGVYGNIHPSHPLWEGGEQPMYRWMHEGEHAEAQEKGFFKSNRNSSPTPQNEYSEPTHVLVKFTSPPGRWRKKDLEGRQSAFYLNHQPIPFEDGEIVDRGRK